MGSGLSRLEHWDHARAHGRHAGRNMAGAREAFDHLSYFFTHVFDLSINVFGETAGVDRTIVSGELGSGRSIVYCVADNRLTGTILINATGAMEDCRALVRARPTVEDLLKEFEKPGVRPGELVG
jgi:NADPH-dependent 2,4-dienoyl-CoA reductase/sulfur reductase-like enzyme